MSTIQLMMKLKRLRESLRQFYSALDCLLHIGFGLMELLISRCRKLDLVLYFRLAHLVQLRLLRW